MTSIEPLPTTPLQPNAILNASAPFSTPPHPNLLQKEHPSIGHAQPINSVHSDLRPATTSTSRPIFHWLSKKLHSTRRASVSGTREDVKNLRGWGTRGYSPSSSAVQIQHQPLLASSSTADSQSRVHRSKKGSLELSNTWAPDNGSTIKQPDGYQVTGTEEPAEPTVPRPTGHKSHPSNLAKRHRNTFSLTPNPNIHNPSTTSSLSVAPVPPGGSSSSSSTRAVHSSQSSSDGKGNGGSGQHSETMRWSQSKHTKSDRGMKQMFGGTGSNTTSWNPYSGAVRSSPETGHGSSSLTRPNNTPGAHHGSPSPRLSNPIQLSNPHKALSLDGALLLSSPPHPLARALTFQTRTSASPSLNSSLHFEDDVATEPSAFRSYNCPSGCNQHTSGSPSEADQDHDGEILSRRASLASSFLDPMDPDARSWVPSISTDRYSPSHTGLQSGALGTGTHAVVGSPSDGRNVLFIPTSPRRPGSITSSAADFKWRRNSNLSTRENGMTTSPYCADDDASIRPLPPSHAPSVRGLEDGGDSGGHRHGRGSDQASSHTDVAPNCEQEGDAEDEGVRGRARRNTSDSIGHPSTDGLQPEWRGVETASLVVLRSSSSSPQSMSSSHSSGSSSCDASRASTKPTTVFSTDSNTWVAGGQLHIPMAHIAQPDTAEEMTTILNDPLDGTEASTSAGITPTLRHAHTHTRSNMPHHTTARSTGGSPIGPGPRPPSVDTSPFSANSPTVPSPLSHSMNAEGEALSPRPISLLHLTTPEFDNEVPGPSNYQSRLVQAPRHNVPRLKDNPRPNSPPDDNASVITLASSNYRTRIRGGTSIMTHAAEDGASETGVPFGGTAQAGGMVKSSTTRSIAGSFNTWSEVKEEGNEDGAVEGEITHEIPEFRIEQNTADTNHDDARSRRTGLTTSSLRSSQYPRALAPVLSRTTIGTLDSNASLKALRGRKGSTGSMGSKFSIDPIPQEAIVISNDIPFELAPETGAETVPQHAH